MFHQTLHAMDNTSLEETLKRYLEQMKYLIILDDVWKPDAFDDLTRPRLPTLHRSAPTTHRNRELPDIFLALTSTMIFNTMDGPKDVMQVRHRLAQDEKSIFCHDFLS